MLTNGNYLADNALRWTVPRKRFLTPFLTWTPIAASAYDNEILYCGYRYDPVTGLYYVRYRYYDPATGTWKTRDLILYPDGMNQYEYCRSDPLTQVDPLGLQTLRGILRTISPEARRLDDRLEKEKQLEKDLQGWWVVEEDLMFPGRAGMAVVKVWEWTNPEGKYKSQCKMHVGLNVVFVFGQRTSEGTFAKTGWDEKEKSAYITKWKSAVKGGNGVSP